VRSIYLAHSIFCSYCIMILQRFKTIADAHPATQKMPVLFIGHGSPMNGIEENQYVSAWRALGETLPRPQVILCISAHWLTEGTWVHIGEKPKTIHDFWGFPEELYQLTYPCPGAPAYAAAVRNGVRSTEVWLDTDWGVDHGTWIVMRRLFPNADIPVFQMSIDISKPSEFHYAVGREVASLRERGVLIVGSGNLVHNLGRIAYEPGAKPYDWAVEFDARIRELLLGGDIASLIAYERLGHAATLAVPTPDHYWPLLYALAGRAKDECITFPVEGITHGSISMRAVCIGM